MSDTKLDGILSEMIEQIRVLLGDKLKAIILYGSYARGDYNAESDIDIMVLVKTPDEKLEKIKDQVSTIAWDVGMEHDIMISAFANNDDLFRSRASFIPFNRNVINEGIELYAV